MRVVLALNPRRPSLPYERVPDMNRYVICFALMMPFSVSASEITSVFVMHDSERAAVTLDWSGTPVSVLDLAKARQIDHQMSASFNQQISLSESMKDDQLQRAVSERMQALVASGQMDQWMDQYRAWGNELAKSSQYRLTKAPAIVFNEAFTVYGVSSLKVAVNLYYEAIEK